MRVEGHIYILKKSINDQVTDRPPHYSLTEEAQIDDAKLDVPADAILVQSSVLYCW